MAGLARAPVAHGADLDELRRRLVAVEQRMRRRVVALEQRVRQLEARRGPRETADVDLLATLARVVGGRPFTARELVALGRIESTLGHALQAAGLDSTREVGCYCRRMANVVIGGRAIRRVPRALRTTRRQWFVSVDTIDTVNSATSGHGMLKS